jgi:hypothetical protein
MASTQDALQALKEVFPQVDEAVGSLTVWSLSCSSDNFNNNGLNPDSKEGPL